MVRRYSRGMKLNNDLCIIPARSSTALPILATRVNDRDSRRCSVIVGWQIFSPPSFTKKNEEGISILAPTSPSSSPSSVSFVVVVAFVVCSAHFSLTAAAAAAAKRAVVVPPPPYHPCLSLSVLAKTAITYVRSRMFFFKNAFSILALSCGLKHGAKSRGRVGCTWELLGGFELERRTALYNSDWGMPRPPVRSVLLHPNCRKFSGFCDSLMSPSLLSSLSLRELFIQYLVMRMGGNLVASLPLSLSVSALSSFTSAAVLRSYKSQIRPREEESVARGEEDF